MLGWFIFYCFLGEEIRGHSRVVWL